MQLDFWRRKREARKPRPATPQAKSRMDELANRIENDLQRQLPSDHPDSVDNLVSEESVVSTDPQLPTGAEQVKEENQAKDGDPHYAFPIHPPVSGPICSTCKTMKAFIPCPSCQGKGGRQFKNHYQPCPTCKGNRGYYSCPQHPNA